MGGFVRIDIRVLDDDFPFVTANFAHATAPARRGSIEKEVDVPVSRYFHPVDSIDLPELRDQLFRNRARSLLQLALELESRRRGQFPEIDFWSLVQDDFRRFDVPLRPNSRTKRV